MSKVESTEAELQKLIIEYEYLRRSAEALRSRLETLNMLRANLQSAKNVLEVLKDKGKGHEILVPIGGGLYVYAELRDTENVLIDLGARFVVEKRREAAIEYLSNRIEEIDNSIRETTNQLRQVLSKISELEPLLRKHLAERRRP